MALFRTEGSSSYKEVLMKSVVGRRVRLLEELSNGYTQCPVGSILKVYGTWAGKLNLETDPCSKCGIGVRMLKVNRTAVELLDDDVQS